MAEEQNQTKAPKPTERVILTGIEIPSRVITARLVELGLFKNEEAAQKTLNAEKELTVWVELGTVKAKGSSKKAAIEQKVGEDQPGTFRAPGRAAWAGGIKKKVPEKIALDVEQLD